MSHEQFTCEACGTHGHINVLRHRITQPGDYCKTCADMEKCAACGELYPVHLATFKEDVRNVICHHCDNDYKEVAKYIRALC